MADDVAEAVSRDGFLGQRLILRQPRDGHRAGSDAVLLAAAAPEHIFGLALDVGAGVGAAGMSFAALRPGVSFGLVERDPWLAALAQDNLAANGFAGRGRVYESDVLEPAARRAAGLADAEAALILTNPPFFDAGFTRPSPFAGKRTAHILAPGATLESWIRVCLALLGDGGVFVMLHKPEALPAMLAALAGRAGAIVVKPVLPLATKPASRVLLRARKASRAPLAIAPAFVLHEIRDGKPAFTREAEALHRGEALLAW